jgi:hypothetical protein
MFLSIIENQSGQEWLRRLAPNESIDVREQVEKWAEIEFSGYEAKISFSEPGSYIPNGCGQYQAEIRDTKVPTGSCWNSEPFYVEIEPD